jgi:HIRAN domain
MQQQEQMPQYPNARKVVAKIAVAFKFPEGRTARKSLKPGDSLVLQREPSNQFDPNAIKVMALIPGENGAEAFPVQIGYVPGVVAASLKEKRLLKCEASAPEGAEITIWVE